MRRCVLVLILSLFSFIILSVYPVNLQDKIDIKEEGNNTKGSIDITDADIIISEVLTFHELVEVIAKDNNISINEAESQVIQNFYESKSNDLKSDSEVSPYIATYRSIGTSLTVTSQYKPTVRFYVRTSEGGSWWGIVKILNVGMNREYNGITKQFSGTVFTHLEAAHRIFWIVNGDFYNNGTTTFNDSDQIKVNETATVSFGVSHRSSHYAYTYKEGLLSIN